MIITNHNRVINTLGFKTYEQMYNQLCIYMHEFEQNKCLDFMYTLETSKFDTNPTVDDCKGQMRLMLGTDRFNEIVDKWKTDNQQTLSMFGTLKYRYKKDGSMWDGLDPEDNVEDYEKVYV